MKKVKKEKVIIKKSNHKPLTSIILVNRIQEENQQKKEQDAKNDGKT